MTIRRWTLSLLITAMISLCLGCGGGSTLNVNNAAAAPAPNISIAFQPPPAGTLFVNATAALTAVVNNDNSHAGVDWSLTCANSGNCGSLLPMHTDSGKPTTYTPPQSLSTNTQTVKIVALATADQTQNVLTQITVTAFAGILKGTYVLETIGADVTGPSEFAGVVVLDGNGNVTRGEQTYNNPATSSSNPITGGTYYVGPDGRGTLTLNTNNPNLGQMVGTQGIETFNIAVLSSSQAFMTKIDSANISTPSNESSQGTMDLQTSVAAPMAGYAFVVNGTDLNLNPTGMGGVFNIDSPGTISGKGSIADQDFGGGLTSNATLSGTVSAPDSMGAVKLNLTAGFASTPLQFTGYIIDGTHMKLIESDNNGSGTGYSTAGEAIGQGAATGSFTSPSSFLGDYVFGLAGEASTVAVAGRLGADGAGYVSGGYMDEFVAGVQASGRFKGPYSIDPAGTGRVDCPALVFLNHNNPPVPELIFYLTGNGNQALTLDADATFATVATGAAFPGPLPVSFSGAYGVRLTVNTFGSDIDATGQMTADPTAGTLNGVLDQNFYASPNLDAPITSTFTSTQTARRFLGDLNVQVAQFTDVYYLVDSNHGFFVETDDVQATLGYFATRSPVCKGCP